jgi:uncharacterized membrane protein
MSPMYPWLLFLHVAAALWLAAGVFASSVVGAQGKRAKSAERALAARLLWRLHIIYTLPGLVVSGFLGFYLVTAAGYRFGETWVLASAALYLLLFLSTLFGVTPGLARHRSAATRLVTAETAPPGTLGAPTAATSEATGVAPFEKAPLILTHVHALIIVLLVSLMTIKP